MFLCLRMNICIEPHRVRWLVITLQSSRVRTAVCAVCRLDRIFSVFKLNLSLRPTQFLVISYPSNISHYKWRP